jgi:hypothetical protein
MFNAKKRFIDKITRELAGQVELDLDLMSLHQLFEKKEVISIEWLLKCFANNKVLDSERFDYRIPVHTYIQDVIDYERNIQNQSPKFLKQTDNLSNNSSPQFAKGYVDI